jgi:peptidoglycan/xylan/chitin deacetylase (PgdA/CDA1 family)
MKSIRELLGFILFKFMLLSWKENDGILSVYFHNPSAALFEQIIRWLSLRGYQFISVQEMKNMLGKPLKGSKQAIITFDDGNKEFIDLMPTIEKYKVPVGLFVPVQPVLNGNYWWDYASAPNQEQYSGLADLESFKKLPEADFEAKINYLEQHFTLNRTCITLNDLKKIAAHPFVFIGSHTLSHPILSNCSRQKQERELSESKKQLANWLNKDLDAIAYPNGSYNAETLAVAREQGYSVAFTTIPGKINTLNAERLELPRYSVNDEGGFYENMAKITGIWQRIFPPN